MQNSSQPSILEITVISAQDLRKTSPIFSHRLRPFITLSPAATITSSDEQMKIYKTRVDDRGGLNPTWGEKFRLALDQIFFRQRYHGIYLQVYTKHFLMGKSQLGWCLIPTADIANPVLPVGATRFLSYRLRDRDGSKGHGVINVAIRLEGTTCNAPNMSEMQKREQTVIGIPVTL